MNIYIKPSTDIILKRDYKLISLVILILIRFKKFVSAFSRI